MGIITEIVTMKTVSDKIDKSEFENIVNELEQNFHSKQSGFIDTELLYDESCNEWTMIQHWESAEQLHAASQKMFQAEEASVFVQSLDKKSIKMKILPQIKTWGL